MANFEDVDKARKLLSLGEDATLEEIKSNYRKMAFRYHPDKQGGADSAENHENMKKLNWAYRILINYCHDYKYSFREIDVAKTYWYEAQDRRWGDNWYNSI